MSEAWVTVPQGRALHARPATSLAREAAAFHSAITIENRTDGRGPVNARSVMSLLSLGASAGARLRICAEGDDADDALAALVFAWTRLMEAEVQA